MAGANLPSLLEILFSLGVPCLTAHFSANPKCLAVLDAGCAIETLFDRQAAGNERFCTRDRSVQLNLKTREKVERLRQFCRFSGCFKIPDQVGSGLFRFTI